MSGHLFITRGDLTALRCDAMLVPSGILDGRFGDVAHHWRDLPLPLDGHGFVAPSPDRERRAVEVTEGNGSTPAIWARLPDPEQARANG